MVATSSLASQLGQIYASEKGTDAHLLMNERVAKASILFNPKVASDLDDEEIFQLSLTGFQDLAREHPFFLSFEGDFFSQHAKKTLRTSLTQQENDELNGKIEEFLLILSPCYLQDSGLKTLEWLIRHFHVQVMNRSAFICSFLLYHETPLFSKALSICNIHSVPQWEWLEEAKRQNQPITREFLVRRAIKSREFAALMEKMHKNYAIKTSGDSLGFPNATKFFSSWLSFLTVLLVEYFASFKKSSSSSEIALYFLPGVMEGMKRNDSSPAFSAYLILFSQLCTKASLSQEAIFLACDCICQNSPSEIGIPAIARLIESQVANVKLPERALSFCLQHYNKGLFFLKEKAAPSFERELIRAIINDDSKEENIQFLERYLRILAPKPEFLTSFLRLGRSASSKTFAIIRNYCSMSIKEHEIQSCQEKPASHAEIKKTFVEICLKELQNAQVQRLAEGKKFLTTTFESSVIPRIRICIEVALESNKESLKAALLFLLTEMVAVRELYLNSNFESLLPILLVIISQSSSSSRMVRKRACELISFLEKKTHTFQGDKEPLSVIPEFKYAKLDSPKTLFTFISKNFSFIEADDNWLSKELPQIIQQMPKFLDWFLAAAAASTIDSSFLIGVVKIVVCHAGKNLQILSFVIQQLESSVESKNLALFELAFSFFNRATAQLLQNNLSLFARTLSAFSAGCLLWKAPAKCISAFIAFYNALPSNSSCKQSMASCLFFDILAQDLSSKNEFLEFPLEIPIFAPLIESCLVANNSLNGESATKRIQAEQSQEHSLRLLALFEFFLAKQGKKPSFTKEIAIFLVEASFETLSWTLTQSSPFDYLRQLILSLILILVGSFSLPDDILRVDLLVQCLRASPNPQIHTHAILAASEIAKKAPQKALDNIIPLFTFMGTNLMRLDDSYSFYVIQQAIQKIIPAILGNTKLQICEIIKVFCNATLHIPKHRLSALFSALIESMQGQKEESIKLIILLLNVPPLKGVPEEISSLLLEQHSPEVILSSISQIGQTLLSLKDFPFHSKEARKALEAQISIPLEFFTNQEHLSAFIFQVGNFLIHLLTNLISSQQSCTIQLCKDLTSSLLACSLAFPKARTIFLDALSLLYGQILNASQFFPVIFDLLLHNENIAIRRKALKILNDKLDQKALIFPSGITSEIAVGVASFSSVIDSKDCNLPAKQVSLMALDMLCRRFGSQLQNEFFSSAQKIISTLSNESSSESQEMKLTIFSALKGFVQGIPHRMIPFIGIYLPISMQLIEAFCKDSALAKIGASQVLSSLLAIINNQGLFLSPYLGNLYLQLINLKLSKALNANAEQTLGQIFDVLGSKIEARVSLPIIFSLNSASPLMEVQMALRHLPSLTKSVLSGMLSSFTKFALHLMQNAQFEEQSLSLILQICQKMTHQNFESFFNDLCEWSFQQNEEDSLRLKHFARFCIGAFQEPNAIDGFLQHFRAIEPRLINEVLCATEALNRFGNVKEEICGLLLKAFELSFENALSQGIEASVSQITQLSDLLMYHVNRMQTADALIGFAVAFGSWIGSSFIASNEHWMAINAQLIQTLGTAGIEHKILFCKFICAFFHAWGEEYLGFLPSLLPVISELVEDADEKVEKEAKILVATVEQYLGEPILKYLE